MKCKGSIFFEFFSHEYTNVHKLVKIKFVHIRVFVAKKPTNNQINIIKKGECCKPSKRAKN